MNTKDIITSWKKKKFAPFYWFEGDEPYFIDSLVNYAEHELLTPEEASFNLRIFYGKDANWADILNACRKYPMFSDKQIVLLKEAQVMPDKDLEKLEPYFKEPLGSTIFIVSYKGKGIDKRKSISKTLAKSGNLVEFKKFHDSKVPAWIDSYLSSKGLQMTSKGVSLLFDHIGNDLGRIANEIGKLEVNLKGKSTLDEDDIEKYIGISKEYNIFELSAAIAYRNLPKAVRILNYIEANPKPFPLQLTLPALYSGISRAYIAFEKSDPGSMFYGGPEGKNQGLAIMKNYGKQGVEKMILLLHEYNLKAIGIDDGNASHPALLKEVVVRIMTD